MVDDRGGASAAFSQNIADTFAATNQLDRAEHGVAGAEGEPRLIEPSAFDAFHRDDISSGHRVSA